jgi:hypothetical protein
MEEYPDLEITYVYVKKYLTFSTKVMLFKEGSVD